MAEFATLIATKSYIEDKYTPAGGADVALISAEELRKGTAGLQEFLVARGALVKDTTADLGSVSGNESKLVLVKNKGLFVHSATGTANGTTIFAASGGGVFTLVLTTIAKDEQTFTSNGTYALTAKTCLEKILVIPASTINIKLGVTPDGDEVYPETEVPDTGKALIIEYWPATNITVYISGITASTVIVFLTR